MISEFLKAALHSVTHYDQKLHLSKFLGLDNTTTVDRCEFQHREHTMPM